MEQNSVCQLNPDKPYKEYNEILTFAVKTKNPSEYLWSYSDMEASNCSFIHMARKNSSIESICPVLLLEDIHDESLTWLWDHWATSCLAAILIGCITINTLGKIFTIYYIKERAPNRPLNDMIFIDQCLQLLPSILHGAMVITSVVVKKPLVSIIGNNGCIGMFLNMQFHNVVFIVGGAGMAFYRLMMYKFDSKITDLQKLKGGYEACK